MRREFSPAVRRQALERSQGRCEGCSALLAPDALEYDHGVPCALGGDSGLDNCVVLCRPCHKRKTGGRDIKMIRKADRQGAKHRGEKQSRHVMPGSRRSKWKRKINGEVAKR